MLGLILTYAVPSGRFGIILALIIVSIFAKAHPDLVLSAMPTEEMHLGSAAVVDKLEDALWKEIAALTEVPVIEVALNAR